MIQVPFAYTHCYTYTQLVSATAIVYILITSILKMVNMIYVVAKIHTYL